MTHTVDVCRFATWKSVAYESIIVPLLNFTLWQFSLQKQKKYDLLFVKTERLSLFLKTCFHGNFHRGRSAFKNLDFPASITVYAGHLDSLFVIKLHVLDRMFKLWILLDSSSCILLSVRLFKIKKKSELIVGSGVWKESIYCQERVV